MKKHIVCVLMILVALTLYACVGGGGDSGDGSDSGDSGGSFYLGDFNESGLPPDPGEDGKLTIEGIDFDDDGVRDDVQRFIAFTYEDDDLAQELLFDYARAQQKFILSKDKDEALENIVAEFLITECIFYLYPNEAMAMTNEIEGEMTNTKERVLEYMSMGSYLGGETFEGTPRDELSNICE